MARIAHLIDHEAVEVRKANAERIREFADRVESGDVCDWVLVGNDRGVNKYVYKGGFDDRWRLVGALESAKMKIWED